MSEKYPIVKRYEYAEIHVGAEMTWVVRPPDAESDIETREGDVILSGPNGTTESLSQEEYLLLRDALDRFFGIAIK